MILSDTPHKAKLDFLSNQNLTTIWSKKIYFRENLKSFISLSEDQKSFLIPIGKMKLELVHLDSNRKNPIISEADTIEFESETISQDENREESITNFLLLKNLIFVISSNNKIYYKSINEDSMIEYGQNELKLKNLEEGGVEKELINIFYSSSLQKIFLVYFSKNMKINFLILKISKNQDLCLDFEIDMKIKSKPKIFYSYTKDNKLLVSLFCLLEEIENSHSEITFGELDFSIKKLKILKKINMDLTPLAEDNILKVHNHQVFQLDSLLFLIKRKGFKKGIILKSN